MNKTANLVKEFLEAHKGEEVSRETLANVANTSDSNVRTAIKTLRESGMHICRGKKKGYEIPIKDEYERINAFIKDGEKRIFSLVKVMNAMAGTDPENAAQINALITGALRKIKVKTSDGKQLEMEV